MLNKIETSILSLGDRLLGKLKYDFEFNYDKYEFLKDRFKKRRILKKTLSKQIYNK